MPHLLVSRHPLGQAKLSQLRAKATPPMEFRRNLQELSMLLFAEATAALGVAPITVETPLAACAGEVLARPVVLVPILRAGLGMLDGILQLAPDVGVGHIGLYRDEQTLRPVNYYARAPKALADADTFLLDPMLATGHSACEAVEVLRGKGAARLHLICIVACPQGIAQLHAAHPDVRITTAAIDEKLDERGYILPGLGDAGDRYFGTG